MLETIGYANMAALIGLAGGILLGLAARFGRFCTLGAIEDWLYGHDDTRMRMWAVAIGVAIIGSFGLMGLGLFDGQTTAYLGQAWNPLASVSGGLVFGYGMAISGNCGYGALARLGGGDMRSFVIVLVMGLSALITLSGPLAWLRVLVFPEQPATGGAPGIAHGLAGLTGISPAVFGLGIGLLILAFALRSPLLRASPASIFWGGIVGLAVVLAWGGTYWLTIESFAETPVQSHTFTAPVGATMLYAMTASGNELTFGIGSVLGVLLGAFIGSLIKGHFRWEACEDPRELRRQILGAALMGVGAVVALGCSIGQGLSAFSVLAWSAPVTFAAILTGAALGLRQLITGFLPAE
ncbi:MAG: YeeE/YedE family protein [Alphaproteobacteria bacterium]|jgi:uncharacterized membrane protein YedE/YeeE|nr:YeeE/YedE family protein [Alphaproteobacteria bacterium]